MAQNSQTSSKATCGERGLERGKRTVEHEDTSGGQTRPFKRPRMVGVGIYQAEDGFTTLNLGLPSKRVINTGTRVTKRADVVTILATHQYVDSSGRGRQLLPVAT
ncbi:hypothetical protein H5410_030378 [Solanum commersonii]|uniref:Uncharacterized protein n=1 Tax=Solanum commersonii TaxID=4109 RepID=A0A9J5YH92_SOLCO|nr:hypothetical protein H5410_030378 [Solanum commersonii]